MPLRLLPRSSNESGSSGRISPSAVQKIAVAYLLGLVIFAWGMMSGHFQLAPFGLVQEIAAFVAGGEGEDSSIAEKLESDLGGTPHRFIHEFAPFADAQMRTVHVPELRTRRAEPIMHLSPGAPAGYRVIFGGLDFDETFWGAVLIDANGSVKNTWRLSTDELELSTEPDIRKIMYGVDILPDGSMIFLMQELGGGIVKVDYCGNTLWELSGSFHHTVSITEDGSFWTFEGAQGDFDPVLTLVDTNTGTVVRRIDMTDVRAANRHIHIFDLQRQPNVFDAVHGNDIDPLPRHLAPEFPNFEPGDLLVSFRTINLVFVLDPDTLEIKWWRVGAWDRQHDPDWNRGGYFSVFSNNERGVGEHSNIVAIDPGSYEHRILIDGSKFDFYSGINGMHQITDRGTILVTSSTQGRVFEVDQKGEIVFEFLNVYDAESAKTLRLSNARYLPTDYFDFEEHPTCVDR